MLVRAWARLGGIDEARSALASGLQRFAPVADLADMSAALAGERGWCGLTARGVLTIALPGGAAASPVKVSFDGKKCALQLKRRGGALVGSLPGRWWEAASLTVSRGGVELLGSPIDAAGIGRAEGFVENAGRRISGWLWFPRDPESEPFIELSGETAGKAAVKGIRFPVRDLCISVPHPNRLARPRGFWIDPSVVPESWDRVHIVDPFGRKLTGAPVHLGIEAAAARASARQVALMTKGGRGAAPMIPLPAVPAGTSSASANTRTVPRRKVDIIVPVYGGLEQTRACLESVLATMPPGARLLIVDDCTPDPAIAALARKTASRKSVDLIVNRVNKGFPGAVNEGLRAARGDADVILLNSDTLTPPGWVERLRLVAHGAADIGTVTPLSNDATILSYPHADPARNAIPERAAVVAMDEASARANAGEAVEIPTAIGFCMYVRRECLDDVGLLREDVFAQGYGEENDFCLRATQLGWKHLAATGIYVGHVGGASFGAAKQFLAARNIGWVNRLHPGYDRLIAEFIARNPLRLARRRLDLERLAVRRKKAGAVLLVSHARIGGVRRRVEERCAEIEASGRRAVVLLPEGGGSCRIELGDENLPNLVFHLATEWAAFIAFLRKLGPLEVELHHFIGHDSRIFDIAAALGVPQDIVVHDYSWFCTRVQLLGRDRKYCGEPELADCEACHSDLGSALEEEIRPSALVERSGRVLSEARSVIAPVRDVARRMQRHFPRIAPSVSPWEEAPHPSFPPRKADAKGVVSVIGAISYEKGYDVLLDCARDAERRGLPIEFCLIGYSLDDRRLLETGKVFITGPYEEASLGSLIAGQWTRIGLLPSIWPETWSYTLSAMMEAGLDVLAFDIGAQAERLRRYRRGRLVPLNTPAAALNTVMLQMLSAPASGPGIARAG